MRPVLLHLVMEKQPYHLFAKAIYLRLTYNMNVKQNKCVSRIHLWIRKTPKHEERILLQALTSASECLTIPPTMITSGIDQVAITVHNNSRHTFRFRKYGPFCAAIRVLETTDKITSCPEQPFQTQERIQQAPEEPARIRVDTTGHSNIDNKNQTSNRSPTDRNFSELGLTFEDTISSQEEAQPFQDLITRYSVCFALSNSELSGCNLAECSFRLKDNNSTPARHPFDHTH